MYLLKVKKEDLENYNGNIEKLWEEANGVVIEKFKEADANGEATIPEMEAIQDEEYKKHGIEEEIYWRKSNQIHNFFVKEVQKVDDCGFYEVPEEKLRVLISIIDIILRAEDKVKAAKVLLPTTSGFFFGSTEYDDEYFRDLEYTKEVIGKALEDTKGFVFIYHSSW